MKFRAVILDYPLKMIDKNPLAGQMLGDVIRAKQVGFLQTEPNFIVLDKHDMIGTHFMIYDVENPFQPNLVVAIRNTYEERARRHSINLPIDGYIHLAGASAVTRLTDLRQRQGSLVDCNAWFVNPEYSFKRTGLRLSEVAFLMVTTFILRKGQSHFVGATNERYNASRWVRVAGQFPEGLEFVHPAVPDRHCVTLVEHFNYDWIDRASREYGHLLRDAFELFGQPDEIRPLSEIPFSTNSAQSAAA